MAGSYRGWLSKNRNKPLVFIPIFLIISFFIFQNYLRNNEPTTLTKPVITTPEKNGFTYCMKDNVVSKGRNFTIYDGYMNICNGTCHGAIEVDQTTLEVKNTCSEDPLNFFLFWSTKREDFRLKHFRVIDSIFRYHPNARLHIFTKSMNISDFSFYLENYDVVHHPLEPNTIFEDTPLEIWAYNIDEWQKSSNFFSHVTDAMRLALLWKYGGVYLDIDAPVLRNIDNIRNAVGVQHPSSVYRGGEINGAVLVFDRQHPFLYFAMHDLVSTYDPNVWDSAGPRVITRCVGAWHNLHSYMVRWVPVHRAGSIMLPNEPIGTPAITVFSDQFAFYPHPWWRESRIDTKPEDDEVKRFRNEVEDRSYAYHYVNHMVRKTGVRIQKGIYLFEVLNRSCLFECSYEDLDMSITEVMDNKAK